jgi:crotonobetainyl-CoA:carnitine CoA-transferase CaiB-like acyl-CoA transferase
MSPETPGGALAGIRVVELAHDHTMFAVKLLGDLGADVIAVEPPGGHRSRRYGPFVDDEEHPDRSLWWWYYNTSKRAVEIDLAIEEGRQLFRRLVGTADLVVEGEAPGTLAELGVDHGTLRAERPELVWLSITPFGGQGPRAAEAATDLTLLAAGGAVWSCGYDDHTIPPVRGGGNQSLHIAGVFGAMSALTALLSRWETGRGQHIDLSMYAAANVTTESGSFEWLVAGQAVQRQTGRHAAFTPTMETQVRAADGRHVSTGFPPHEARDYVSILGWLDQLGLRQAFGDAVLLELGVERGGVDYRDIGSDPVATEIYGAGREALCFIAAHVSAHEFFVGTQERDIQCGVVYAPEEALEDEHFVARGFPVEVGHPELDRVVVYPGAPFKLSATPWAVGRRPPLVGEHNALLDDLG